MVSPSFEMRNLVKFQRMSLSFSTLLLRFFSLQTLILFGGSLCLQIFEDGFSSWTIDITLFHNLEGYAVVQLAELLNLSVVTWILFLELVAGETDNDQSLVLVFLVQFLQSCKLRSETTLAGCVDNQQYLTLELSEINLLAFARLSLEIINLCHTL